MYKVIGGLWLFATVLSIISGSIELAFITGVLSILNFLID